MPEIESLSDGMLVMYETDSNGFVLDETSLVYHPRADKTQRLYNSQ